MKIFLSLIHFWVYLTSVATAIPHTSSESGCSNLIHAHFSAGVKILQIASIPALGLNVSSTLNQFELCRVQGIIKYQAGGDDTPDDNGNDTLTWELFLPTISDYNGRYLAVGNGGFAGTIDEATMLTNLNQGYAVAGCDGGHSLADSGNNTPFAPYLEDPAKVRAWIHDSIAMTTAVTRSLTADYYSRHPRYSYYYGCSTGGAQGYALAQFHPELFDGIYAGSPGNWYSHLILSFLWNGLQTQGDRYMSQDVLNFVTDKVVAACDEIDGVIDGLIEDPQKCLFDITALECKAGQYPVKENNTIVCMTTEQIKAAQAIYQGPKDVRAGKEIYPGFSLGSENGWLGQETMLYPRYAAPILKELVFNDSNYNISQFNWGTDIDVVDRNASPLIDEISPDLSHFQRRGGKLISTQGWADQYNAATWPIQHLMQIRQVMTHADFIELFMVPGGGHCGSNPNYPHVPATYHVLDELVPWVEKGIKPVQMLSSGAPDGTDTTRKLCPYPKTANFVGNDQNDWNSYTCT